MADLTGKVAVITGAASGIGEASARRFAADGAFVVVADIDDERGPGVADEIGGLFVRTDVSREADIEGAVAAAIKAGGRLDVFFANAGTQGVVGPITTLDPDGFDRVLGINLRGVALSMKHACLALQAQGTGGSFISTSSVAGLQGGLGPHIYSATKGGINALTRSVAREQAPFRIRVNAICPGGTVTNAFANGMGLKGEAAAELTASMARTLATLQPIRRAGLPEDVANVAAFLASDESEFVTAQTFTVDGGLTGTYSGALASSDEVPDAVRN